LDAEDEEPLSASSAWPVRWKKLDQLVERASFAGGWRAMQPRWW
jgi:hypothetical protein